MSGRALPLWRSENPDAAIPLRVRIRVFERHDGRCYLSGRKIFPGDAWDLDHIKPLHLGGAHAEDNLAPVLRDTHRLKSGAEVSAKAKADRVRAKHLGLAPPPLQRLRSRPFPRRFRSVMPGSE